MAYSNLKYEGSSMQAEAMYVVSPRILEVKAGYIIVMTIYFSF
ncbi:hypothetical protein HPL003_21190 [Paenibacillus terrae HPL-003]|uniref:Uncharacterized protein n=1 Tax=Paenibacillus terrae (strain HPL-003) TaxID=985665 RepID=G7VP95_PAETH|nr:hypothetical protein HPL003_21190 [Paenibacillus terrae HPL-003]